MNYLKEIIEDLNNVEHWSMEGLEIIPMNEIRKIIEKYEKKLSRGI